ncbi:MAG: hypothetical protein JXR37_04505 [Kiritimatiellae bacterium]|nr:hypothetical protein [Kiritimatiellia bacterium]
MKKRIIYVAAGVVLVPVALLLLATAFLGSIVKSAVNEVGPAAMGVKVSLQDADFSILRGKARLAGLFVGNPEGFDAPSLCELGEMDVHMRVGSVLSDTVVIDRIYIRAPQFTYQRGLKDSNVGALLKQLEGESEQTDKTDKPDKSEKAKSGKKVIIHELVIEEARVNLSVTAAHKHAAAVELPRIHIRDIGKEKGGASVREALGKVFRAVAGSITNAAASATEAAKRAGEAAKDGILKGVAKGEELGGAAVDSARERVHEAAEKVKDAVRGK